MSTFEIGDRVEFTPTKADGAYPGDLEQYRGQQGTVIDTTIQRDSETLGLLLLGESGMAVVDVNWDNDFMREADDGTYAGFDPEARTSFNANLTKIKEGN